MATLAIWLDRRWMLADPWFLADVGRFLSLKLLRHFLGARTAAQPFFKRAVRVNFLIANQTMISVTNRIQAAATALDGFTLHNNANSHPRDDEGQQAKCQKKCLHGS